MTVSFDDFPTPAYLAKRLVRLLDIRKGQRVLEPHANRGRFIRALQRVHPRAKLYANEIQPQYEYRLEKLLGKGRVRMGDFMQVRRRAWFDWVVMNPPFSKNAGIEHMRQGLRVLKTGGRMAALLPTFYLHQKLRREWWFTEAPLVKVFFMAERPSFSEDGGTDRYTYAWYLFEKGVAAGQEFKAEVISVDKAYLRELRTQARAQHKLAA